MPVRIFRGVIPYIGTIADSIYSEYDYLPQRIGVVDHWKMFGDHYSTQELIDFAEENDMIIFISEEILEMNEPQSYLEKIKALSAYNSYFILASIESAIFSYVEDTRLFKFPWFHRGFGKYGHSLNFKRDFNYVDKEYTFNMLLGKEKSYRDIFYRTFGENKNIYSTYLRDINTCKPAKFDHLPYSVPFSHIIPEDIYSKTHFDIVTESQPNLPETFITEKTGKALYSGRFFLPYASSEIMTSLMGYGYSVDSYMEFLEFVPYTDDVVRLARLFDTIDEINASKTLVKEIYKKTAKEREYNSKHIVREQMDFVNALEYYLKKWISNPKLRLI